MARAIGDGRNFSDKSALYNTDCSTLTPTKYLECPCLSRARTALVDPAQATVDPTANMFELFARLALTSSAVMPAASKKFRSGKYHISAKPSVSTFQHKGNEQWHLAVPMLPTQLHK